MNSNGIDSAGQLAVDLRGVGVLRDQRWILKDIDWQLPAGTLAAVLGPNGSGKSTLARIVACHAWPSAGDCSILGERFGEANLLDLRKKIRMVQAAGPYDVDQGLSARQVVLTGFFNSIGLYQNATAEMDASARRLLERVGLSEVMDHTYATLSSGERVRALIARAMAARPRLLILDEPTAGLDLLAREQVLATMQAMMELPDPPTVILVTHHVEELPPATGSVILLSEGRAAACGTMGAVLNDDILSRVYGCPVGVRTVEGRYYVEIHPSAWDGLLLGNDGVR